MKIYVYSLILILLMSTSCEDFLDKAPKGNLTSGNFPGNADEALLAVNGVYNTLRIWNFNTGGFPIIDIMSDEVRKGSNAGDAIWLNVYDDFTFDQGATDFESWWATLYQGIRRANLIVEKVPGLQDLDEDLKTQYIAEARFLRAFFYFELVRTFGDVPKVLSITPETSLSRSPVDEIYNEIIIPDMEFGVLNLPQKDEYPLKDMGRITSGTCSGMLAKVYLYRKDFINAEKYAMEVIDSKKYSLDPDFSNALSVEGEFGTGSVFEVGAAAEGFNEGGNQYANTISVRGTPNLGWGFGRPTYELIQEFGSDPRADATILFVGEVLDGVEIEGDISTPDTTYTDETKTEILEVECYNQKVYTPGDEPRYSFGHNRRLLRYADVLLMAAEALNENDKPVEALFYVNLVRERARGGNENILPDITQRNKDLLRDLIIDERHFELALEGHRFYDLVRTGKAEEVLGPLGFKKGTHELMPVPLSEINISEGKISQNDGYDL
ncbi:MAG: RagB/SusD family nutrient uptake outer membrane protein [Bacteroidales bacterium]|nr:RagB/SusD family nutrient uptake outer membrane protein [Bacteroidales bacterium]MCF8390998.1 RagB/SusD family nutrient uptake outer membrane protein [Bacteroidales bacterium]